MGRNKKKKQSTDSLSIGKKLFLILLLSFSFVATGIFAAFSFGNAAALVFAVPAGILAFVSLFILLKDYKIGEKGKTAEGLSFAIGGGSGLTQNMRQTVTCRGALSKVWIL